MKACFRFFTLGVLLASTAAAQPLAMAPRALAPPAEAHVMHALAEVGAEDPVAALLMLLAYEMAENERAEDPGDDDRTARLTAFPNPTMGEVAIRFELERAQRATLEVFDLLGRPLQRHDLGVLSAGQHEQRLDLGSLPPGLYVVRLTGDAGARATVRVTRAMGA